LTLSVRFDHAAVKLSNEIFTTARQRELMIADGKAGAPNWPRAAVFDCDGVLIDSGTCWEAAYAEIAAELGRTLTEVDLVALAGASVTGAAEQLSRDLGTAVAAESVHTALRRSFAAAPPAALPGARPLTARLARRMPLAVASNAPADLVQRVLTANGLAASFTAIVSAEETRADKPAPDVYLAACDRIGIDPSDAVAFEDSPRGAEAARRAGLLLIGVSPFDGRHLHADLLVPSLLDPRLESVLGLPDSG
jgi:HAD superfamily hydrolase (TIGR01509 family)